ncbi:MAG: excinuclease ABC subunit C [Paludibacteraceae bacterium]|nr:excinuclease ABC subunit C [Paludibacteraceae bacterium]
MPLTEHIRQILSSLPEKPGVYQHLNKDGEIIYVGKAKNLKRRVSSYFQKEHDSLKTRQLVSKIEDIHYIVVDSEQDAFLLENNLIKQYQPYYNILLKDGKSYPSICITKEEYPRIFKTRNLVKGAGEYYGPYSFGNTVDLVLELIHDLYPLRTCRLPLTEKGVEEGKWKVCLKYYIHRCSGVCEGHESREKYLQQIEEVRQIIRGDAHEISKKLLDEMGRLSQEMRFEEAQELKRKYDLIEKFKSKTIVANTSMRDVDAFGYMEQGEYVYVSMLRIHNGSIVQGQTVEYRRMVEEEKEETLGRAVMELRSQLGSQTKEIIVPFMPDFIDSDIHAATPTQGDRKKLLDLAMQNVRQYANDRVKQQDKLNPDQRATRILGRLQQLLQMEKMPVVIDSFDNSNIQGTNAVAGCVVFKMAKPSKADYKRFIIKTVEGQDDYASMREVVYRKYKRMLDESASLPDLIIADGGIGQMHAIREAVEDQLGLKIPIAGLVKNDKHRTQSLLFGFPPKEIGLRVTDEVFRFLTQIQDEVHRFAISYHKQLRSKAQTRSELDEVRGVGEKTKLALLKHFKSVKRIREAEKSEIEEVVGKSRASIIYDYFHGENPT